MPIPVDYFQPQSFQQANPFLAGLQTGQDIYKTGMQNAYLPQTLQQQLQKMQLGNQQTAIQNQYLPQESQGKINLMQAQIPLMQAQTQNEINYPIKGDITATVEYANQALNQYGAKSPQAQSAQNALSAQIEMLKNRALFYGANVDLKNLPNPVKNQIIANGYQLGRGNMVSPQANATAPQMNVGTQQNSPQQGSAQPLVNLNNPSVQSTAQNAALKETSTNQILNQRQYSQILGNLMDQAQPLMPSVAKYAGAQGQAQLVADKVAASTGTVNPDYQNYLVFTRTYAPVIANEMRRTLGGQATDSERNVMDKLTNPSYWDSNFPLAMQQYTAMQNMYKTAVNPALSQSLSQVQKNLQSQTNSPATNATPNISNSKVLNGKTYTKINGTWYTQ